MYYSLDMTLDFCSSSSVDSLVIFRPQLFYPPRLLSLHQSLCNQHPMGSPMRVTSYWTFSKPEGQRHSADVWSCCVTSELIAVWEINDSPLETLNILRKTQSCVCETRLQQTQLPLPVHALYSKIITFRFFLDTVKSSQSCNVAFLLFFTRRYSQHHCKADKWTERGQGKEKPRREREDENWQWLPGQLQCGGGFRYMKVFHNWNRTEEVQAFFFPHYVEFIIIS